MYVARRRLNVAGDLQSFCQACNSLSLIDDCLASISIYSNSLGTDCCILQSTIESSSLVVDQHHVLCATLDEHRASMLFLQLTHTLRER